MTVFSEAFTAGRARRASRPARTRTPVLVLLWRVLAVLGGAAGRLLPSWPTLRRAVLTIGGLAAVTWGAWSWADWAGWVALGLSLLIVEALTA